MNKRKLMTIDDLVKFCREQNFTKFSSKESGYKLAVQVPATFEVDENTDNAHRGMLKLKFRIFHTGLNRNGSFVSEEAAKNAMPTIKNRPILATIHQLDNGEWDFESHNFEVVENEKTGEEEIVYIEKQVGSFDESEPFFEYDEELDKTFICSYGYISEDYTKAADIIKRKGYTKNSCELSIDELSFNAKESYLSLDKFYVAASTLLGSKKDGTEIQEGMEGSRADIADFCEKDNSVFSHNEKLIEMLEQLNTKIDNLSNFAIEGNTQSKSEEGGNKTVNKFEELLNQYGKTVEDIAFEYENLSDEELEAKFAEVFGEENTDGEGNADPEPTSEGDENGDGVSNEEDYASEDNSETNDGVEESSENNEENNEENTEQFSEKLVRTYEISHDDIRYALYNLLAINEEADNEWYFINAVYDNHFTYESWTGEKIYGQSYTKDDSNVAFDGERWNLHRELLTDSEYAELMSMRSNYASLVQFKEDTENAQLRAQREEILNNEKYSVLAEKDENNEYKNEAYAKLVSEMDNYSLVDLEKELKSVFADYITNGGQFAYAGEAENKSAVNKKLFNNPTSKKTSRYGNLFDK